MSLSLNHAAALRTITHQQMLVDVGIVLEKAYGGEYAKNFLDEMNIAASVVQRVLTRTGLRPMRRRDPPS